MRNFVYCKIEFFDFDEHLHLEPTKKIHPINVLNCLLSVVSPSLPLTFCVL